MASTRTGHAESAQVLRCGAVASVAVSNAVCRGGWLAEPVPLLGARGTRPVVIVLSVRGKWPHLRGGCPPGSRVRGIPGRGRDRKSTRLNQSQSNLVCRLLL